MKFKSKLLLYLKGMAMGAADSVPGISGGTVALITNIYEELIFSIQSVNHHALKLLLREGPAAAWRHINGTFLVVLLAGILTSLLLLANVVLFLLANYEPQLLAFFGGLILASCWYMTTRIRIWKPAWLLFGLAGAALAVALAFVPESAGSPSLAYFFFSGALAICAMILPGISGAFILILLGAYGPVLDALRSFELAVILVFAAGCASGLLAFSNLLGWLFRHHHEPTMIFLFGILIGSLYSIWPWKVPVAFRLDSSGEEVPTLYRNLWPGDYARVTGDDFSVLAAALLVVIGFLLVYVLEKTAGKYR